MSNRLVLKRRQMSAYEVINFAIMLNRLVLKPRPCTSISRSGFATVSTRIIALPAYRSFQLDHNYFGFTQGSQTTL